MYGVDYKPQEGSRERLTMLLDWENLIDPRLCAILLGLGEWAMRKWGIGIVITCLNRTTLENYKAGGIIWSAHLKGRAADIRSWTFTVEQIDAIVAYLTATWGNDFLFVKAHNGGAGHHIHININYKHNRGQFGRSQAETT